MGGRRITSRLQIPAEWRRLKTWSPYLYLMPSLIIIGTFVLIPILYSLYLSFQSWDLIRPAPVYVGLDNYRRLLVAEDFRRSLWNTLLYTAGSVPLSAALGLGVAMILNRALRGRAIYRSLYFAPVVTSTVAIATVWTWIYHPQVGLFNAVLEWLGLPALQWLSNPKTAMLGLIIMSVWKSLGYNMVLFLAGLQEIPTELYEAARVDGANEWQVFRYVTLPLLVPTMLFVLVIATIQSFQAFAQVDVMTQGGPAGSTEVVVYNLYHHAFQLFQMGYASAIAWVLFAILIVLTAIQMRIGARRA